MIVERKCDLFKAIPPNANIIIAHGCNTHGVMGSGFAAQIKAYYPDATKAYEEYVNQHVVFNASRDTLLGKNHYHHIGNLTIANCFTQNAYGRNGKKFVSYDAIDECLEKLSKAYTDKEIYMPQIGAGLGGGHWPVINEIIEHRLRNRDVSIFFLD